jgi:hypothetical protein
MATRAGLLAGAAAFFVVLLALEAPAPARANHIVPPSFTEGLFHSRVDEVPTAVHSDASGRLYIGGEDDTIFILETNSTHPIWHRVPYRFNDPIRALYFHEPTNTLFIGTESSNVQYTGERSFLLDTTDIGYFAAYDVTTRTLRAIRDPRCTAAQSNQQEVGVDDDVFALAFCNGLLYLGGKFSSGCYSSMAIPLNRVAAFNITSGSFVVLDDGLGGNGPGVDSDVTSLACNADTTLYGGRGVWVGGKFSNAGGVASRGLVLWNGTTWVRPHDPSGGQGSAGGLDDDVMAVSTHPRHKGVWAGGMYSTCGGKSCNMIGFFDTSNRTALNDGSAGTATAVYGVWRTVKDTGGNSGLDNGGNDQVNSIAYSAALDAVFLGGKFQETSGGDDAYYFIRVDLANFTFVEMLFSGNTVDDDVYAVHAIEHGPYAGTVAAVGNFYDPFDAYFIYVDGADAVHPGSYNVVGGVKGVAVYALVTSPSTGFVYVGGDFSLVGTSTVSHFAAWTGTQWRGYSGGLDGIVRCLTLDPDNPDLIWLGGDFQTVVQGNTYFGKVATFNTATNSFANPILDVSGGRWFVDGSVYAVVPVGTKVYVGGSFNSVTQMSLINPHTNIDAFNIFVYDSTTQIASPLLDLSTSPKGVARNGVNAAVHSILMLPATMGGGLLLGGEFDAAAVTPLSEVAVWDGSVWDSTTGSGQNRSLPRTVPGQIRLESDTRVHEIAGDGVLVTGFWRNVHNSDGSFAANTIAVWNITTQRWGPKVWPDGVVGIRPDGIFSYVRRADGTTLVSASRYGCVSGTGKCFGKVSSMAANGVVTTSGLGVGTTYSVDAYNLVRFTAHPTNASLTYLTGYFSQITRGGSNFAAASCIAVWDGVALRPHSAATIALYDKPPQLSWSPAGVMYMLGDFTDINTNTRLAGIARWTGSAWAELVDAGSNVLPLSVTSSFGNGVHGMLWSGTSAYIFGVFYSASVSNIVIWDSTTSRWSPMRNSDGTGLPGANEVINTACFFNGVLYLGGAFSVLGTVTTPGGIGRWTGTRFEAVGSGLVDAQDSDQSWVNFLHVIGTSLWAVGNVLGTPSISARGIAHYNIATGTYSGIDASGSLVRSATGSGADGVGGGRETLSRPRLRNTNNLTVVHSLTLLNASTVVVGGDFASGPAGAPSLRNVALLQGTGGATFKWLQMPGGGLDGTVRSVSASNETASGTNGTLLVAGGDFSASTAGTPRVLNKIASWTAAAGVWSPLTDGNPTHSATLGASGGIVKAVTTTGDRERVYVGGTFDSLAGIPSTRFGEWMVHPTPSSSPSSSP